MWYIWPIKACINNNTHQSIWIVIAHPCSQFNGSVGKLSCNLGHGWDLYHLKSQTLRLFTQLLGQTNTITPPPPPPITNDIFAFDDLCEGNTPVTVLIKTSNVVSVSTTSSWHVLASPYIGCMLERHANRFHWDMGMWQGASFIYPYGYMCDVCWLA